MPENYIRDLVDEFVDKHQEYIKIGAEFRTLSNEFGAIAKTIEENDVAKYVPATPMGDRVRNLFARKNKLERDMKDTVMYFKVLGYNPNK